MTTSVNHRSRKWSVHMLNPGKSPRLFGLCIQACDRPVHSCADRRTPLSANTTLRKVVLRKCNSANTDFQNHHSGNRCLRIPLCTGQIPDQSSRLFGLCIQACERPVHSCADRCFRKWCLRNRCCAKWCCAKWCCANTTSQNHHFRESPVCAYALYIG